MLIWGIAVGGFIGWIMADFEGFGLVLGGVLGLAAAVMLRRSIRTEIRKITAELGETFETQLEILRRAQRLQPIAQPSPQPVQGAGFDNPAPAEAMAPIEPEPIATEPAAPEAVAAYPTFRPVPRSEPAEPPEPNFAERGFLAARDWLFGGNTIVRAGLVILFVGLSFLARYAAMAGLFPIELRLAAVGGVGIALLATGFSRRLVKPDFALALQGAGVAVLYLTVFGAARLFDVVPLLPAFAVMVVVCALGCALALLQNSQSLAVVAFAGGFAVPLLLGGDGSSIGLFGYYAVLNLAVLFIAQRRSWRIVNLVGFFATFGVATAWGVLSYKPAEYASSQAFLVLFVLIYVLAAILHARNTPGRLGNFVDSTLLFGPALVGFGLQVGLVRHLEYGSAFSALGFAALYITLAALLVRRGGAGFRLLLETMVAIGVGFITLAVPLALGARWTSSAWALEGAGAFWVGMRQARWLPRLFGLLLIAAAGTVFVDAIGTNTARLPIIGPATIGAVLIAASALAVAWWLRRPLTHSGTRWASGYASVEPVLSNPVFLFGFLFWCLAFIAEITRLLPPQAADAPPVPAIAAGLHSLLVMLAFVVSALAASVAGRRTGWPVATWPGRAVLAVLALTLAARIGNGQHILATPDWLPWIAALALHYILLHQADRAAADQAGFLPRLLHIGSVWLVTVVLADCLWFGIDRADLWNTSWAGVVLLVSTVAILFALALWAGRANHAENRAALGWPRHPYAEAYYWTAALPIAAAAYLGTLATALFASGNAAPLPYVPLLNPVDLTCGLALAGLVVWQRTIAAAEPLPFGAGIVSGRPAQAALAIAAFTLINTIWLRIAHHYLGIAWTAPDMLGSSIVQTGLAILWTLLALALMLVAHRRVQRQLWLIGAGLLGAVVVKLLIVDLSNTLGGERIIAFIVVGLLMLVVGYFVPLPPRPQAREATPA